MEEQPHNLATISKHMVQGVAWMIFMRWVLRTVGVVNVIILARLLTPDDFGVIAMAMIVIGFLRALAETGVGAAVVRNENATEDDYNSAWTLKIIAGLLMTVVLITLAPLVAKYFDDERVLFVMQIIALQSLILGFENIGVVDFQKNLQFRRDFFYSVIQRLSLFVFALALVIFIRDYRALAIAAPVSGALTVIISYAMSPYRPRLCFTRIRAFWFFSQWLILVNVSRFVGRRVDEFIIGGIAGAETLGTYFMAADVSGMATRDVIMPAGRALLPTFAKVAHDVRESRKAFLRVFGLTAIYAFPAGVGISVVAGDLVPVLLGGNGALRCRSSDGSASLGPSRRSCSACGRIFWPWAVSVLTPWPNWSIPVFWSWPLRRSAISTVSRLSPRLAPP